MGADDVRSALTVRDHVGVDDDPETARAKLGALAEPKAMATSLVWASAGGARMTPEIARALAMVGEKYGLDPGVGEIQLIETRAYITLEGYLALAHRHPQFAGLETWVLSETERAEAKVAADEHAYGCRVYRKDWRVPAIDTGMASDRTIRAGPLKAFAREVAKARAVRRALKLAFRWNLGDPEEGIDLTVLGPGAHPPPLELEAGSNPQPNAAGSIEPDWAGFWARMTEWGVTRDQVHEALRVGSVKDYDGSLAEARDVVWGWIDQHPEQVRRPAVVRVRGDTVDTQTGEVIAPGSARDDQHRQDVAQRTLTNLQAEAHPVTPMARWNARVGEAKQAGWPWFKTPTDASRANMERAVAYQDASNRYEAARAAFVAAGNVAPARPRGAALFWLTEQLATFAALEHDAEGEIPSTEDTSAPTDAGATEERTE